MSVLGNILENILSTQKMVAVRKHHQVIRHQCIAREHVGEGARARDHEVLALGERLLKGIVEVILFKDLETTVQETEYWETTI